MSHKPPLSPYCPKSFPHNSSMFTADRVYSSPSIMQSDHAESARVQARSSANQAEMILLDDQSHAPLGCTQLKPSRLSSETNLNSLIGDEKLPESGQLSQALLCSCPNRGPSECRTAQTLSQSSMLSYVQSVASKSAARQALLQTNSQAISPADDMQSGDTCHVFGMCKQETVPDAYAAAATAEQQACCSRTAVEAAATAAGLPCQTASSSPCCTFQLPSALSQGITASPAPQDSDASARRNSFSPLDTGPVSILPMVENPETGLPSISSTTLGRLLTGQHNSQVTVLKILDCRCLATIL